MTETSIVPVSLSLSLTAAPAELSSCPSLAVLSPTLTNQLTETACYVNQNKVTFNGQKRKHCYFFSITVKLFSLCKLPLTYWYWLANPKIILPDRNEVLLFNYTLNKIKIKCIFDGKFKGNLPT